LFMVVLPRYIVIYKLYFIQPLLKATGAALTKMQSAVQIN
jgi:hypothetical protein